MRIYTKPELKLSLFAEGDVITMSDGLYNNHTSTHHASTYTDMGDQNTARLDFDDFTINMGA